MIIVLIILHFTQLTTQSGQHTIILDTVLINQKPLLVDTDSTLRQQPKQQSISNYYNYQYVGTIRFMSSSQLVSYRVIFDTGSTTICLPNVNCTSCKIITQGVQCESPNCQSTQEPIQINYQLGSIIGEKAKGMFSIDSNFSESNFILVHQTEGMEGAFYEGIVGLSPNSNHSFITWPISFYYNSVQSDRLSSITFGGIDESLFDTNITYISTGKSWSFQASQISLNDFIIGQNINLIVDSGSSLLILPKKQLLKFEQEFKDCVWSDIMKCSCPTSDLSKFPTLYFTINNQTFSLPPNYYVHLNMNDPICYVLISSHPSYDDNLMILGSPFMRKYYSIFDKEYSRIGLVEYKKELIENQQKMLNKINILTVIGCIIFAIIIIKGINILIQYQLTKSNNAKSLIV